MKYVLLAVAIMISLSLVHAEVTTPVSLPKPEDVFTIATVPASPNGPRQYFTAESLYKALPDFRHGEAEIMVGVKRYWQSGVIVLKNKEVLFWTTCRKNFIHITTTHGHVSFIIGDGKDDI